MKKILAILTLIFAFTPYVLCSAQTSRITMAYVCDNDGPVTNIRDTLKGNIIQQIPTDWDVELTLTSPVNGWWKILEGYVIDNENVRIKHGYIHYSCLMQGTRNYDQQIIYLRQTPSPSGKKVCGIRETEVRPIDISSNGKWVKVVTADGRHTGWIESYWLCGSAVTNCC